MQHKRRHTRGVKGTLPVELKERAIHRYMLVAGKPSSITGFNLHTKRMGSWLTVKSLITTPRSLCWYNHPLCQSPTSHSKRIWACRTADLNQTTFKQPPGVFTEPDCRPAFPCYHQTHVFNPCKIIPLVSTCPLYHHTPCQYSPLTAVRIPGTAVPHASTCTVMQIR
eukprot:2533712-Rhodomonas_salina.4